MRTNNNKVIVSHRTIAIVALIALQLSSLIPHLSSIKAQPSADKTGMITLNPYVDDGENLDPSCLSAMQSKLSQIATVAGTSGEGFDNRFVITAHITELEASTTATAPPKTAVKVAIGIYVGDGIDGTLFSSYVKELKGIGDSKEQAYASAIKKLQVRDPQLLQSIELGKQRIVDYYDQVSPEILRTAEAAAGSGKYDEAVSMLFAIPMSCRDFQKAQQMIAKYGEISLENANQLLINNARAVWSASPDENGAAQAMQLLNQLNVPSAKALADAKALSDEIASRLKAVSDREWQLTVQQEQHAHSEQMARIKSEKEQNIAAVNAAASAARAYYKSRPRVVYHVHSWW